MNIVLTNYMRSLKIYKREILYLDNEKKFWNNSFRNSDFYSLLTVNSIASSE